MQKFDEVIRASYTFSTPSFTIGKAIESGKPNANISINIPFSTLNRHGLIAWATGTGKTKTLQKFLESCSKAGIPSVMMDIKGDISGVSLPWTLTPKLTTYLETLWNPEWKPQGFPVEFFSLFGEGGSQIRSTVSECGPTLFSRILGLSATQESALNLIFHYADSKWLLLVDLEDIKTLILYLSNEWGGEMESLGYISPTTFQVLLREIVELQSQWGSAYFGEPSLDMNDLMRVDDNSMGQINIIRLMNSLRYPRIFSTMMIQILVELYNTLPEVWDLEKPKLIVVIDEAHVLFDDISKELLEELQTILKLIRSKWVGIFFCTQNPVDIDESILGQLGLKIEHALRVFTARDQDAIKKMAKNFPISPFYDTANVLTTLGIGEALISTIGPDWRPTELVATKILPPESRMDVITESELNSFLQISPLYRKYSQTVNPESAQEILGKKIADIQAQRALEKSQKEAEKIEREQEKNPTLFDTITKTATKSIGTELGRSIGTKIWGKKFWTLWAQIARGVLGSIFGR